MEKNPSSQNKKIKTYVLASKGKSFVSRLIRKFQQGFPYTHIAYVLEPDKENPLVIEAWHQPYRFTFKPPFLTGGGVYQYYFAPNHTPGTEFTIFSIEVTPEQKEKIENFLIEQLGRSKYDFKGILGFATFSDYQNPNKWFCSELVYAAYKQAGVELLNFIEPYKVTPRIFLLSPYVKKEFDGKTPVKK
jgi:hypothetical protein